MWNVVDHVISAFVCYIGYATNKTFVTYKNTIVWEPHIMPAYFDTCVFVFGEYWPVINWE